MRFLTYQIGATTGLATSVDGRMFGILEGDSDYPGDLQTLIRGGAASLEAADKQLRSGAAIDPEKISLLPPVLGSSKILCVGQNYREHVLEMGNRISSYPLIFARFASSLVGHGSPIVRPHASIELDYEGELAVVIGRRGRHVATQAALDYVAGYSIFNDGSVRDYQTKTSQYTMGKNFDRTGAFGPMLVTADELPAGARHLWLETRLNGAVMQRVSTDDMMFDIPTLISTISAVMTLEPGDVIVTGTPSGVGKARKPPVFLKPGDVCEVEITGLGILRNPVTQEE